jgi:hypothetical protein
MHFQHISILVKLLPKIHEKETNMTKGLFTWQYQTQQQHVERAWHKRRPQGPMAAVPCLSGLVPTRFHFTFSIFQGHAQLTWPWKWVPYHFLMSSPEILNETFLFCLILGQSSSWGVHVIERPASPTLIQHWQFNWSEMSLCLFMANGQAMPKRRNSFV